MDRGVACTVSAVQRTQPTPPCRYYIDVQLVSPSPVRWPAPRDPPRRRASTPGWSILWIESDVVPRLVSPAPCTRLCSTQNPSQGADGSWGVGLSGPLGTYAAEVHRLSQLFRVSGDRQGPGLRGRCQPNPSRRTPCAELAAELSCAGCPLTRWRGTWMGRGGGVGVGHAGAEPSAHGGPSL